eukprot:358152-Chlamydomonas_euryale.AAC.2
MDPFQHNGVNHLRLHRPQTVCPEPLKPHAAVTAPGPCNLASCGNAALLRRASGARGAHAGQVWILWGVNVWVRVGCTRKWLRMHNALGSRHPRGVDAGCAPPPLPASRAGCLDGTVAALQAYPDALQAYPDMPQACADALQACPDVLQAYPDAPPSAPARCQHALFPAAGTGGSDAGAWGADGAANQRVCNSPVQTCNSPVWTRPGSPLQQESERQRPSTPVGLSPTPADVGAVWDASRHAACASPARPPARPNTSCVQGTGGSSSGRAATGALTPNTWRGGRVPDRKVVVEPNDGASALAMLLGSGTPHRCGVLGVGEVGACSWLKPGPEGYESCGSRCCLATACCTGVWIFGFGVGGRAPRWRSPGSPQGDEP